MIVPPTEQKFVRQGGWGTDVPNGGSAEIPPGVYIYITLHLDVWFLLLTVGGGLVCFVTVGGVYVYAVECMTMCVAGRLVGRVIPPTI